MPYNIIILKIITPYNELFQNKNGYKQFLKIYMKIYILKTYIYLYIFIFKHLFKSAGTQFDDTKDTSGQVLDRQTQTFFLLIYLTLLHYIN